MDHKEVVRSDGRSGGLLLLWKKDINISLRFKSDKFIDVLVDSGTDDVWRFTSMYGEPNWVNKEQTWQTLCNLNTCGNLPWLIMGDLNEILYSFEKEGGNPRPQRFLNMFREALDDCNLEDFGFIDDKFTWKRGNIRERLDRALTNDSWNNKFVDAVLTNLEYNKADHRPILMCMSEGNVPESNISSVLRFEARWLKEDRFREVVQEAWDLASPHAQGTGLVGKLSFVHDQLHRWDKAVLKSPKR